ncbi:3-hydroxyacyl-CoA dehydrogenase [Desarmillaria ectypa]|nr:3-hydroxyacyl-CoA dehydrogenase [Desarmillaria ectypa]
MKIENRTFIVSGGASGLGLAAVKELIHSNAFVSILDKDITNVTPSPRLLALTTDITKNDEISIALERTVSWTQKTGAPLGGVIHCAGIGVPGLMNNVNASQIWDATVSVNLSGTFHLTQFAMKYLVGVPLSEDGERGVIIMVSSSVAYEGLVGQVAYAGSKGAIRSMTLPMARELAKYAVRVVTIAPSSFTTPMTDIFGSNTKQALLDKAVVFPKRFGHPSEFAHTVKWVLECGYVNGESIKLTGGTRTPVKL